MAAAERRAELGYQKITIMGVNESKHPPRGHRADDSTPQARDKRPHKWGLV